MNNNHRYPLRAAQSEQLLQKRTKQSMPPQMGDGSKEKRMSPTHQFLQQNQENSSAFANKKMRRDLSHHTLQPIMKAGGNAAYAQGKISEMKLKKTNPRLASKGFSNEHSGGMNQRKGKQLKKIESKEHQQHQFMQYPTMHMPQYPMQAPFAAMAPQMMPMGMQFPVQQMNPHMVSYQSPQIAEMQKQINLLSQMTYMQSQMQQMQQHHGDIYSKQNHHQMSEFAGHHQMPSSQFPGSYFPTAEQGYAGIYGQMPAGYPGMAANGQETSNEQEEYYEEDQEQYQNSSQHSQDETNENQMDRSDHDVKPLKSSKKTPGGRVKDLSRQSSPKRDGSDSKNRKEDSGTRSKRNISGDNVQFQDPAKKAPNYRVRDQDKLLPSQERVVHQGRNAKKNKLQEIHDNKNIIDDGNAVRRTTRSMLNKNSAKKRQVQKGSPNRKKQATPTQVKLQAQQTKQKSNSRSPKTSPLKGQTPKKQAKVAAQMQGSQEESSQQVTQRETRYSSRLSSAKQSMTLPTNVKGMTDKQKVLQSLKDEIEAANFNQRELLNQKKSIKQNFRKNSGGRQDSAEMRQTRASAVAAAQKSPTKDEMILFGGQQSQRSLQEKSEGVTQKSSNPLLKRHRKEAQTEIVDRRYDEVMQNQNKAAKSVNQNNSDDDENDEEERRIVSQLQKEKEHLQKQLELNIMDEQKLKDMSILFGIPEEEVQAIQKQQQEQLQKMKDQQMLFGDEGPSGEVNEFSTQNPINVKNENIVKSEQSQNSEVRMTKIIADNGVIDVDQSRDVKTEQEEILLFNDNSTTQDQQQPRQQIIKEEVLDINQQKMLGQDINIILEVQKPAESSSQDMKLERSKEELKELMIKQQQIKLTIEDERMLFSDEPHNVETNEAAFQKQNNDMPQQIVSSSNQQQNLNSTSIQMNTVTHMQQISSSNNVPQSSSREENILINGDNIAQEPDDTFKIDEQHNQAVAMRNTMLMQNSQQDSRGGTDINQINALECQDRYETSRKTDQIESMQLQQENLKKQIELLQQQIDKDQEMIKEQNLIMSAQKEQKELKIKSIDEHIDQQQIVEEHEAMAEEQDQEDSEDIQEEQDNDQIMQEHDGREFEVQLEAENNLTSNEMIEVQEEKLESAQYEHYGQQQVPVQDITTLVDNLPLPDNYELLASFLGAMDQGLNICHSRQYKPNFLNLRKVIQSQTQRAFNLNHFKQLLFLCPGFYLHHWEPYKDKMDIVIQIPSNVDQIFYYKDLSFTASETPYQLPINSSIMRARVTYLRKLLLQRVYKEYENFMKMNSTLLMQNPHDYDIFLTKRWPGLFDLNNPRFVTDIPIGDIKEQPQSTKQETVQDFIQRNDQKEKIREAMEKAQKQNTILQASEQDSQQLSDSSEEMKRRSLKPNAQTGLKESTLAAIRMKEELESKSKINVLEQQQKQEAQKNFEVHLKIAEQIRQIFQYSQGSTMKLRDLCQKIAEGQRSTFQSSTVIKQQIDTLQKIMPEWLKFIPNVAGTYIKVHKNLNWQQFPVKQRIQNYFNPEQQQIVKMSQDTSAFQPIHKKRERLDSEQARSKQQVMDKSNEPQRQTKSCPPVANGSQSQEQTTLQQQSAQERSYNQSAISQKSNSLSHRQQDQQSSQHQMNVQHQQAAINLSNQQNVIKKGNNSAFQPFQKQAASGIINSQSQQSESQIQHMQHQIQKSSTIQEHQHQFVQQPSRGPSQLSHQIENSDLQEHSYRNQPHVAHNMTIQPSSNSLFKQVAPQNQRSSQQLVKPYATHHQQQQQQQLQQEPISSRQQQQQQQDNNCSSGTYLTGSCESNKNPPELEGGAMVAEMPQIVGKVGGSSEAFKQQHASASFGNRYGMATNFNNQAALGKSNTYGGSNNMQGARHQQSNGIDNLLRQVMSNADQMQQNKNYSPVKKDILHQRQQQQQQQHVSSHQQQHQHPGQQSSHHGFDSNSISASMGPQLGNDLYQAMNTTGHGSSRGRGYSGSYYGGQQSNNTHHPSMLAMEAVDDDDMEEEVVHHQQHSGHINVGSGAFGTQDYHMINSNAGQMQRGHHQRNRMNSNEREDGRQQFGQINSSRFSGQQGFY